MYCKKIRDIIEYAKSVCSDELINNKDFYNEELISRLQYEIKHVIKYGDRNIGFKNGVTGLAYSLLKVCDPKIFPGWR